MRSIRLLFADDDRDHTFLAMRALEDYEGVHFDVMTVTDGQQALDYLWGRGIYKDEAIPDMIILDLKMPKIGGLEVLTEIKSDPDLKAIPVIVLSASTRQEDIDATYVLGGNSYVTKTAGLSDLRAGIEGILRFWANLAELPTSGSPKGALPR